MPRTLSMDARNVYLRHRRRARKLNGGPTNIDADIVRAHIARLRAGGLSVERIAVLAPVSLSAIRYILEGDPTRNYLPARRTSIPVARAILAVQPTLANVADNALIDGTATRRRLQALAVAGWGCSAIGAQLHMPKERIFELLRRNTVRKRTAILVAALYEDLAHVSPTGRPEDISRVRNLATTKGWAPALAWDDDTIGDPRAQPALGNSEPDNATVDDLAVELVASFVNKPLRPEEQGMVSGLNDAEVTAAIVALADAGHTWTPIGDLLRLHPNRVRTRYLRVKRESA